MKLNEILDASLLVGYHLLCNGADIYRVEQSIDYICRAYGIEEAHIFAIPGSIVVTISNQNESITKSKRVVRRNVNLDAVEKFAALSRYICSNLPEYSEVGDRVEEILSIPPRKILWQYAARMISGASFCMFAGGHLQDGFIAAFIGAFIFFLTSLLERLETNSFFITIFCSFSASFIGGKLGILFPGFFLGDKIVIGGIMLLVPGIALANSMRDFIASDTMTGLYRMSEAILVALGVAIGVAMGMFII